MIDFEVKIFNRVHASVAPLCAKGKFISTMFSSPPTAFPAASLAEIDNITVTERQSSTPKENFGLVTYQLDVYATSKAECRKVLAAADEAMIALNFNRMSSPFAQSASNEKVFRYTARYEAMIDPEGNIYRRG